MNRKRKRSEAKNISSSMEELIEQYLPADLVSIVVGYTRQLGLPRNVLVVKADGDESFGSISTTTLNLFDYHQLDYWFEPALITWLSSWYKHEEWFAYETTEIEMVMNWSVLHPFNRPSNCEILIKELAHEMITVVFEHESKENRPFQIYKSCSGKLFGLIFLVPDRNFIKEETIKKYDLEEIYSFIIMKGKLAEQFVKAFYQDDVTLEFLNQLKAQGWQINQPEFVYNPMTNRKWTALELVINRVSRKTRKTVDKPWHHPWTSHEPWWNPVIDLHLLKLMLKHGADPNLIPDPLLRLDLKRKNDQVGGKALNLLKRYGLKLK